MGVQGFVNCGDAALAIGCVQQPVARMAITPSCASNNSNTAAHLPGQQGRGYISQGASRGAVAHRGCGCRSSVFKYAITSPICAGSSLNSGGMAGDDPSASDSA